MNRYAVIDTETTGLFVKSDRLLEIAIVLIENNQIIEEWETLINPERDISNSEIHGITASDVTLAPVFLELALQIATLLNGNILVAHNISFDKRFLEMEFRRANFFGDFGFGFCTLQATGKKLDVACKEFGVVTEASHRALTDARATAQLFIKLLQNNDVSKDLSPVELAVGDIPSTYRLLSRSALSEVFSPGIQDLRSIFRRTEIPSNREGKELAYLDGIASVMSDFEITSEEKSQLDDWARTLEISETQQKLLHKDFLDGVIKVAKQDGVVSEIESLLISKASKALGIEATIEKTELSDVVLKPGMRICFTGKATDKEGLEIPREILEARAMGMGMTSVPSVSKKNCDVVVTEDISSASGKAKKAREYGIPVITVLDFLDRH